MNPSFGSVHFGQISIRFKLLFVDRNTLEIAVHPDNTVIVKAPVGTDYSIVEHIVLKRAHWIIRQLDYFSQYEPRTSGRYYVGGASHLYLGRRHRLKISPGPVDQVKLMRGFLMVSVKAPNSPEHIKRLLDSWYDRKAAIKFNERLERCWSRFTERHLRKPRLRMRKMKRRWGSLSKNGLLTLNTELIRAPKECIDYVITHELCHLRHHDHGPGFYRLLEKVMPDWEKRKLKLELALV